MKRLSILALLVALTAAAMAQVTMPNYTVGDFNKDYSIQKADHTKMLYSGNGEYIIAAQNVKVKMLSMELRDIEVIATDQNLKTKRSVSLPTDKAFHLVDAKYVDGNVNLLLSCYQEDVAFVYYRAVVNAQTMKVTTQPVEVVRLPAKAKDNTLDWSAWSANQDFFGLVLLNLVHGTNEYTVKEVLMDEAFNVLWNKIYDLNALQDMMVTNEGEMVTIGLSKGNGPVNIVMNYLDVEDEKTFVYRSDNTSLHSISLLNMVNGNIVACGNVESDKSNKRNTYYDAIYGFAYNIKSEEGGMKVQKLNDDELNILGNRSIKKPNKFGYADAFAFGAKTTTSYGGAAVFNRNYSVTTRQSNGMTFTDYFIVGSVTFGVDTTGRIVWHKPFRTEFVDGEQHYFGHLYMLTENDVVYLLQEEAAKAPATYDLNVAVKRFSLITNAHAIATYGIDRQGNVTKGLLKMPDKGAMMGNLNRVGDGKYLMLSCDRRDAQLIEVKF